MIELRKIANIEKKTSNFDIKFENGLIPESTKRSGATEFYTASKPRSNSSIHRNSIRGSLIRKFERP